MHRYTPLLVSLLVLGLVLAAPMIIAAASPIYLPLLQNAPIPTATPTASRTPTPRATATLTPTATPTRESHAGFDVRVAAWCSNFDAEGDDRTNLNDEYVCFQSYDAKTVSMDGWTVRDAAGTSYRFPPFSLASGAHVYLHTGSGYDTATDLYWGRGSPVWNNDTDTVYLYDAAWTLVDEYSYGP